MNEPKLSVYQAIQKSMILWGIKNDKKLRIYYVWDLEKRTRSVRLPCIVVDYKPKTREWNIFHYDDDKIMSCTIDDITGTGSTQTNII